MAATGAVPDASGTSAGVPIAGFLSHWLGQQVWPSSAGLGPWPWPFSCCGPESQPPGDQAGPCRPVRVPQPCSTQLPSPVWGEDSPSLLWARVLPGLALIFPRGKQAGAGEHSPASGGSESQDGSRLTLTVSWPGTPRWQELRSLCPAQGFRPLPWG